MSSGFDLDKIFDQIEQLRDDEQTEEAIYEFYQNMISIPATNPELIETAKQIVSKKELNQLKKILKSTEKHYLIRAWAAEFLTLLGGKNELPTLEYELFKRKNQENEIYNAIVRGLSSLLSDIDVHTRTELLLKVLEQDIDQYLDCAEELMNYKENSMSPIEDAFLAEGAGLLNIIENKDNLKYFKQNLDILEKVFVEFFNNIHLVRETPSILYYLSQILDQLGERDLIVRLLEKNLSDPTLSPDYKSRFLHFARLYGTPELALFQLLPIFNDLNEESVVITLGEIGRRNPDSELMKKMVEPLTKNMLNRLDLTAKFVEHPPPSIGGEMVIDRMGLQYLRTLEYIQGLKETATYIASLIIKSDDEKKRQLLMSVLGWLKEKNGAFNEFKRYFFEGTKLEHKRAEDAMTQMGFSDAVKLLVAQSNKEIYANYVAKPIEEIETKSLKLLDDTVTQIKSGYGTINLMGKVVFFLGIVIVAIGAIIVLFGRADPVQMIGGSGSVLLGLTTILINFTRGPVKIVQEALADLVQVETAFLGYIRRSGLASYVFLREYLNKTDPNIQVFNAAKTEMKSAAGDALLLIELYSGGSEFFANFSEEQKKSLLNLVLSGSSSEVKTEDLTN